MEIKFNHEQNNIFDAISIDKRDVLKLTLGFLTELITGEEKIEEVYNANIGTEIATIGFSDHETITPDFERFKTNTLVQKAYIATLTNLLKNLESPNSDFDARAFYYIVAKFTDSGRISEIVEKVYRMALTDSTFYLITLTIIKRNIEVIFESMSMILKDIAKDEEENDEYKKRMLLETTVNETLETLRESGITVTPEMEEEIRKRTAEKLGINDQSKDTSYQDSDVPDKINWDDLLK